MYVRRSTRWMESNNVVSDSRDYFTIPVNLKWKMRLPLGKPFRLPVLSSPFSLTSGRPLARRGNKKIDYSWNFGAGVKILGHLQLAPPTV